MTTDNNLVTIFPVLVFKTNICSDNDLKILAKLFGQGSKVSRWNVDVEDIDKVLRIEGESIDPTHIINVICSAGFECEELPD
jgi:hypothetical protein